MAGTKALAAAIAAAAVVAGCGQPADRPIRVGSKNFTEQVVLGEIVASSHPLSLCAWLKVPPRWTEEGLVRALAQRAIAVTPSDPFVAGEVRPGGIRICLGGRLSHAALAETLASVLATIHAALWAPEDLDERAAMAEEVVAVARSSGHADLEASGLGWLVADRLEAGDVVGADHAIRRHAQLATRLKQRLLLRDVELWRAMRAMLDGHLDTVAPTIEPSPPVMTMTKASSV